MLLFYISLYQSPLPLPLSPLFSFSVVLESQAALPSAWTFSVEVVVVVEEENMLLLVLLRATSSGWLQRLTALRGYYLIILSMCFSLVPSSAFLSFFLLLLFTLCDLKKPVALAKCSARSGGDFASKWELPLPPLICDSMCSAPDQLMSRCHWLRFKFGINRQLANLSVSPSLSLAVSLSCDSFLAHNERAT